MKIIHTADWHLGKSLKGASLIDDQNFIMNEILKCAEDVKPDALIIAGDVYDRGVPPAEAVNLFDEIIFKICEKKIPVICISGNHDSAARLNFGSRLLSASKFFLNTKPEKNPSPIVLEDNFGEVYFSPIPFFEPADIREKFNLEEKDLTTENANKIYIDALKKNIPSDKRSVAIAHLFVTGGEESESERKFVGNSVSVGASIFSAYNYTALGHLHKPQKMTSEKIRYSGSPLKYSFDEANHKKGINFVELNKDGEITVEKISLQPLHDVRIITDDFENLMKSEKSFDYIHADITDKEHTLNAIDKLREIFPNILSIKFIGLQKNIDEISEIKTFSKGDSPLEHFAEFFEFETGEKISDEYKTAMEKFLKELKP